MFQNDYILREIENLTRFLGKTLFQKGDSLTLILDEDGEFSPQGFLLFKLRKLVMEGEYNKAENLLFEEIQAHKNKDFLPVAVDFYRELSLIPEKELLKGNYTKSEIADGIKEINNIFEIE